MTSSLRRRRRKSASRAVPSGLNVRTRSASGENVPNPSSRPSKQYRHLMTPIWKPNSRTWKKFRKNTKMLQKWVIDKDTQSGATRASCTFSARELHLSFLDKTCTVKVTVLLLTNAGVEVKPALNEVYILITPGGELMGIVHNLTKNSKHHRVEKKMLEKLVNAAGTKVHGSSDTKRISKELRRDILEEDPTADVIRIGVIDRASGSNGNNWVVKKDDGSEEVKESGPGKNLRLHMGDSAKKHLSWENMETIASGSVHILRGPYEISCRVLFIVEKFMKEGLRSRSRVRRRTRNALRQFSNWKHKKSDAAPLGLFRTPWGKTMVNKGYITDRDHTDPFDSGNFTAITWRRTTEATSLAFPDQNVLIHHGNASGLFRFNHFKHGVRVHNLPNAAADCSKRISILGVPHGKSKKLLEDGYCLEHETIRFLYPILHEDCVKKGKVGKVVNHKKPDEEYQETRVLRSGRVMYRRK